jgi:hypothetical protein
MRKPSTKRKPKVQNPITNAKSAFRTAIRHQIEGFKALEYKEGLICPLTELPITKKNVEVDHILPFRIILQDFITKNSIDLSTVHITYSNRRTILVDQALTLKWQAYHLKHATLRLTTRAGNRQRPKSDTGTK